MPNIPDNSRPKDELNIFVTPRLNPISKELFSAPLVLKSPTVRTFPTPKLTDQELKLDLSKCRGIESFFSLWP